MDAVLRVLFVLNELDARRGASRMLCRLKSNVLESFLRNVMLGVYRVKRRKL